jgi:hypothetical protein
MRSATNATPSQKNGVVVRQVVGGWGHGRLMGEHASLQLDELYRALHWYVNCFQPRVLLVAKQVEGRTIQRIYDVAKTPLQRVLSSGVLLTPQQQELRSIAKVLDPLRLFQQVEHLQQAILRCEAGRSSVSQTAPIPELLPFDLAGCAEELVLQEAKIRSPGSGSRFSPGCGRTQRAAAETSFGNSSLCFLDAMRSRICAR